MAQDVKLVEPGSIELLDLLCPLHQPDFAPYDLFLSAMACRCNHIFTIYHFDTLHQRKPQGYISNIPWEQVYIMIYPAAIVTNQ